MSPSNAKPPSSGCSAGHPFENEGVMRNGFGAHSESGSSSHNHFPSIHWQRPSVILLGWPHMHRLPPYLQNTSDDKLHSVPCSSPGITNSGQEFGQGVGAIVGCSVNPIGADSSVDSDIIGGVVSGRVGGKVIICDSRQSVRPHCGFMLLSFVQIQKKFSPACSSDSK